MQRPMQTVPRTVRRRDFAHEAVEYPMTHPAQPVLSSSWARRPHTILGHPAGLYVLFFTQMWERFSFFGMLGLLILYLTKSFKLPQEDAGNIFKWYTTLIFFAALPGGYLADRVLGNKRSIVLG